MNGNTRNEFASFGLEILKRSVLQHKPMFQIRPQRRTAGEVRGGGDVIRWKWKTINAKIAECLAVAV